MTDETKLENGQVVRTVVTAVDLANFIKNKQTELNLIKREQDILADKQNLLAQRQADLLSEMAKLLEPETPVE